MSRPPTHGKTDTPTWNSWAAMRARCLSPSAGNFKRYGAKGITICKRWNSFENFLADIGERPTGLSLERKNSKKPYSPSNCRWASAKEQAVNRSSTVMLTHLGKSMCLSDWAKQLTIQPYALKLRINRWGLEKALTTPPRANRRRKNQMMAQYKHVKYGYELYQVGDSIRVRFINE